MLRATLLVAATGLVAALDEQSYGQPCPVIGWSGIEG